MSVVIPCLNEAETVGRCVEKALRAMRRAAIDGEVVVADNGSADGSVDIARTAGARVVSVAAKGYGNALMGGIDAARGRYVVMGDADDSYDFEEIPRLVAKLREGYDLVMGCRLPQAGGRIAPGAMPVLHRLIGNPLFSFLVRRMFGAPIHDVHCGLRGFDGGSYRRLGLRCTGMEYASEMVIKASLFGQRMAEVPITLHPDGRRTGRRHLRTFRDGWRHLRFYLIYSPRWLFLLPGLGLSALGLLGYAVAMPRLTVAGVTFDVHTLLFASLAILLGFQSLAFGVFTKTFAVTEGLLPADPRLERFLGAVTLERGLTVGAASGLAGAALLIGAIVQWLRAGLGDLDYAYTMRWAIPGVTLCALGVQTVFSSFLVSILRLARRPMPDAPPS